MVSIEGLLYLLLEAAHTETVIEVTGYVVLLGKVLVAKIVNGPEEVVMKAALRTSRLKC